MRKCDKCNKQATSTIQDITDGYFGEIEQYLCAEHARAEMAMANEGRLEDMHNAQHSNNMFFVR